MGKAVGTDPQSWVPGAGGACPDGSVSKSEFISVYIDFFHSPVGINVTTAVSEATVPPRGTSAAWAILPLCKYLPTYLDRLVRCPADRHFESI